MQEKLENNILSFFQFQVWFKAVIKTKNHNHVEKVKCWRFALRYHFASCHSNRACWCPKCLGPRRLVIGTKGNSADFSFFSVKWYGLDIAISRNILIKKLNLMEGDGFKLGKLIKTVICKKFPQNNSQYDEPDLNKSQKTRPKTRTASKVIPLGSRITIVWNPTNSGIS